MVADECIKNILEKASKKLIDENLNKWLHFERRFMVEINRLHKELKELKIQIEKGKKDE